MLDAAQGRGAGSAGMSGNGDVVGISLGHAGGNGSNSHFGNQFHTNARLGIHLLEIVNQLGNVLDAVDVVMRGRAN